MKLDKTLGDYNITHGATIYCALQAEEPRNSTALKLKIQVFGEIPGREQGDDITPLDMEQEIDPTAVTGKLLKALIADDLQTSKSYMRLILGGQEVEDDAILAAVPQFHNGATLCVMMQKDADLIMRVPSSGTVQAPPALLLPLLEPLGCHPLIPAMQGTIKPKSLYFTVTLTNSPIAEDEAAEGTKHP